ncbi:hypothetical protein [Chitinophaga arvensicola]|uniref:Uncharacterized protein n=1 Tax=Chitinophaga arvensicola TaxID=29529 RepID=A0A1I0R8I4_9BACT|nr:hypothetical protein [Chitinophaga arvensicola]SEW37081.1 hypothetical protein SAMN04488122_2468 [Chitinophaga arvensicola]
MDTPHKNRLRQLVIGLASLLSMLFVASAAVEKGSQYCGMRDDTKRKKTIINLK